MEVGTVEEDGVIISGTRLVEVELGQQLPPPQPSTSAYGGPSVGLSMPLATGEVPPGTLGNMDLGATALSPLEGLAGLQGAPPHHPAAPGVVPPSHDGMPPAQEEIMLPPKKAMKIRLKMHKPAGEAGEGSEAATESPPADATPMAANHMTQHMAQDAAMAEALPHESQAPGSTAGLPSTGAAPTLGSTKLKVTLKRPAPGMPPGPKLEEE